MATIKQVQRRQKIQVAEGYLDLAMALDQWPLDLSLRQSLADRAMENLDAIEKPLGHKPYILFLKGQACRMADRFSEAINHLDQSLKLDPDNLHAYLALAWCYKRTDHLDLAIEAMQSAVELDSESAIAHYNLACYCALNREIDLALMHLSFALDLNSDFRELVAKESDFDSIRENPRFASIASATV
jgi:tetratricopeptide (TPR) repeat protein